jgi:prepilin-type N-terminal cleavage/methylation domain-containing protein
VRGRRRGDAAFTLVELMVTIAIAGLVSAGTFAFFSGQQTIYDVQSKLLTVQQTVWSAMDTVTRSLRSAGGGMLGCVRADADLAGVDTGDPPPGGATAPQTGLRVSRSGVVSRIAPLWIKNGVAGAPDTLTIAYGSGASGSFSDAALAAPVTQPLTPIQTLAGQTVRFLTGEFILLVNGEETNGDRGCTLFQLTGIAVATNTLQTTSAGSTWNSSTNVAGLVPFTYLAGSVVVKGGIRNFGQLTWIQFAIDSTGAPAVPPRLTMNRLDGARGPEVLAEGIEDMQISYGCDLAPVGAPDGVVSEGTDAATRLTDEWTYNQTGDVPQVGCNRPDAVRITLIGRSLSADALLSTVTNAKPAAEDGVAGTADRFRHRVATVSVHPWN